MFVLYRIFVHRWKPGSFLSDSKLITCVLLLVVINIVISIMWTVIAPYSAVTIKTETVEEGVRVVTLAITCSCQGICYMMFGIEMGYLGSILLSTATLTLLTRNIRRKNFSTISLRALVYTLVVVLFVGLPAHTLLIIYRFWVWSVVEIYLVLNMITFLFLIFDFTPPLITLIRQILLSPSKNQLSPSEWQASHVSGGLAIPTSYASPSQRVVY